MPFSPLQTVKWGEGSKSFSNANACATVRLCAKSLHFVSTAAHLECSHALARLEWNCDNDSGTFGSSAVRTIFVITPANDQAYFALDDSNRGYYCYIVGKYILSLYSIRVANATLFALTRALSFQPDQPVTMSPSGHRITDSRDLHSLLSISSRIVVKSARSLKIGS